MSRRYVTLGCGPAAIKACESIRAIDPTGEITVISEEPEGYYSRPGLAYYLAGEVSENGLFPLGRGTLAWVGATFVPLHARELRTADHQIILHDGRAVTYDRLLLATGSRAVIPPVEGAHLDGVVKLDNLDDARRIVQLSQEARSAVVIGGGITALEIVEGLAARKVKVHYLIRKDRYWSDVLAESESRLVEDGLREAGVEVHYFTELGRVLGRGGRVSAVETAGGEFIPCQLVGFAVGVVPRKELAEAAGLECERGVVVDDGLRSSDPDVFAAGDLAEMWEARAERPAVGGEPVPGRRTLEVLWSSAVEKGRVAGLNMAARDDGPPAGGPSAGRSARHPWVYRKALPLNVTRLARYRVVIMGRVGSGEDGDLRSIARGDSETWRRIGGAVTVVRDSRDSHVRLSLEDGVISGAVVIGGQQASFALQGLVAYRVPLGRLEDRVFDSREPLVPLLEKAWSDHRSAHVSA